MSKRFSSEEERMASAKAATARGSQKLISKKRTLVNNLKNRPCVDCGQIYESFAMEFDHIGNGDKIKSISEMIASHATDEQILKEIQKCELVCVLCHRIRTENRSKLYSNSAQSLKRRAGRDYIRSLKCKPCADCQQERNPVQLDFDHKPGSIKKYNISKMTNMSKETILAEVSKCDLICVLCHRRRTHSRKQYRHNPQDTNHVSLYKFSGPNKLLTDAEVVNQVISSYKTGQSVKKIAQHWKVSGPLIIKRLRENGIKLRGPKGPRVPAAIVNQKSIVDMYRTGASAYKVGEFYGISDSVVYSVLKNNDIKRRTRSEWTVS